MSRAEEIGDSIMRNAAGDGLLDRYIHIVTEHTGIIIKKRQREGMPPNITFLKSDKGTARCLITYPKDNDACKTRVYIAHELGHVIAFYEEIEDSESFSTDFAKFILKERSRAYKDHVESDPLFFSSYVMSDEDINKLVDDILSNRE